MTVKAVVFDLDGTIASFNIDYRAVRAEVRSLLIKKGLPTSVLSTNESIFEMLKKAEVFFRNNSESKKSREDTRRKALAIAEEYELEAAKSTDLLPGVNETLKALKRMRLRIGLFTINSEKSTDYILKRFRIAGFFDAVVARNRVKHVKPNKEHLEVALKVLGTSPDDAMVVGDGFTDMQCAREMNAIAVGLPTGFASPKDLVYSGANYLITSMIDLPELIVEINKSSTV